MVTSTKRDRIKAASELLLNTEPRNYRPLKAEINRMLDARDRGLAFVGTFEPLNALVELKAESPSLYEQLMEELDRRRMVEGSERQTPQQLQHRQAYMREYMRQYRAKLRKERRHPTTTRDLTDAIKDIMRRAGKKES